MAKQDVNYITHHKNVNFKMIELNLNATHISLYNALFLIWNECGFDTELSINRNDVMKLSKIGSANTYTKCLKELDDYKIIGYKPSHNPLIGSKVNLYRFDNSTDNSSGKSSSKGCGNSTGNSSGKSIATLYKLLNKETIKQLNNQTKRVADFLNKNLSEILKGEESEKIIYPFEQKEFIEMWQKWKIYKKEEHNFKYKSEITEQAALMKLSKLTNDYRVAVKILMQSIENGYKGFFELKKETNGGKTNSFGETVDERAIRLTREFQEEQEING